MLGERLAELRKDTGLTQRQFAEKMNVSLNTISSWERNLADPDDKTKVTLARMFGVSLDYLMGLTDQPTFPAEGKSALIYFHNLPPAAARELHQMLRAFRNKYNL